VGVGVEEEEIRGVLNGGGFVAGDGIRTNGGIGNGIGNGLGNGPTVLLAGSNGKGKEKATGDEMDIG
jgi:hypothetical protein